MPTSLDPPQAVLPKTKPRTGGNEARISTAVGAPTGTAVPVRMYQAAQRLPPRTPYEQEMPGTQAPPHG